MRRVIALTLAATATLAAAAPSGDAAKLDKALAGRVAGKSESCVTLRDIQSTATFSDPDTILYTMRSGVRYVNRPAGGCGLRGDPIIVSSTPSTRICRGDIITLVDRTSRFQVGGCGLGDFVPYTKAK